jgi:uncharacterized membrane protein YfcA
MNKYVKQFFLTGACFAGLGPIILGYILWMTLSPANLSITGGQVFLAIVSTYIIAFVHAGTTVFHRIESWSPLKAAVLQLLCIYAVYMGAYLINRWMPLNWKAVLISTIVFVLAYVVIWIIIFTITKSVTKKLNKKLDA